MSKDTSKIPFGHYCYIPKRIVGNSMEIDCCPYWDKVDGKAYCYFLERDDDAVDGVKQVVQVYAEKCLELEAENARLREELENCDGLKRMTTEQLIKAYGLKK